MAENSTDNVLRGVAGKESVDAVWIIVCTFIIFTMQSGFALLESGLFLFLLFCLFQNLDKYKDYADSTNTVFRGGISRALASIHDRTFLQKR